VLPEGCALAKRLAITAILQVSALTFFLLTPLLFPQQMQTALKFMNYEVSMPITLVPVAPPPPPPKIVKVNTPPPRPVVEPILNPKQPHIFVAPKLNQPQPKVHKVDTKA